MTMTMSFGNNESGNDGNKGGNDGVSVGNIDADVCRPEQRSGASASRDHSLKRLPGICFFLYVVLKFCKKN